MCIFSPRVCLNLFCVIGCLVCLDLSLAQRPTVRPAYNDNGHKLPEQSEFKRYLCSYAPRSDHSPGNADQQNACASDNHADNVGSTSRQVATKRISPADKRLFLHRVNVPPYTRNSSFNQPTRLRSIISRKYSLNISFNLLDLLVLWLSVGLGSLGLLAYGVYQFRKTLRLREYNFRAQVVSDLHDNLSSRLYALKMLSDQLTVPAKSPERQAQRNVRLSELALDCMQVIGNIIWAFDPSHNNVDTLLAKVHNFTDKAISPLVPVEVNMLDRKRWPHQVINSQTNHLVLMVYQELLTNMIKHTASVKIQIDIYWKDSRLIINIHNYFSKPPATSISKPQDSDDHYGLDNISSRLLKIKGKMDFDQDSNAQHVHLVVPF